MKLECYNTLIDFYLNLNLNFKTILHKILHSPKFQFNKFENKLLNVRRNFEICDRNEYFSYFV